MILNGPSAVPVWRLFESAGGVFAPRTGEITVAVPGPPGDDCFTQTSAPLRPGPSGSSEEIDAGEEPTPGLAQLLATVGLREYPPAGVCQKRSAPARIGPVGCQALDASVRAGWGRSTLP